MKAALRILLPGLVAALGGCAMLNGDDAPTIADLGKRPAKVEDRPLAVTEQQAMAAYRSFLATDDQTAARPQAMRRLADINLEVELEPQAEGAAPAGYYPQQVQDSIVLYREVLERYPDRPDNDLVLYQLSRAYELGGEPDRSLAVLAQLIGRYPDSQYWVEAQFRRGEIRFVQKQYAEAGQSYQAVVTAGPDSAFYEQSLYKLGWSHFKQSLYTEGLHAFTALLDRSLDETLPGQERLEALSRAERERIDDTLRVMSLSFSYEEGPRSVAGYFGQFGSRHYEDIVYGHLGTLYLDKERYTDAAQTFQTFADNNPLHRQAPAFQMRVIDAYQAGKFPTLVLEGKKDFVERYNLQSEYWQHHDRADTPEVLGFLKQTMTDLSRHYHAQAQASKKAVDYAEATRWYRSFLGSFADSKEAPEMNFLLAELLFEAGHYADATHEYVHTAYDYAGHPRAAEAGYAAVLAWDKHEAALDGEARADWHRAGIENALRFATGFPEHPQALAVQTRSAEQLLALHDNARAIAVAQQVLDNASASGEQQRVCWTVQAHAWFDEQDYLHAERAYQQVLARTAPDAKEKSVLTEKLAASIYKQGEAAMAAGEIAAAVAHFQRVRVLAPESSIVATADYDAAAGLLILEDWSAAAAQLQQFRSAWPDDPRQAEVTRRLASAYVGSAQHVQAAQEFERIGRSEGETGIRNDALWQAAELYEKGQQAAQAVAVYEYIVQTFPQPVEPAIEARQHIADYHRARGVTGQQHAWLEQIIQADRAAGNARSARTRHLAAHAQLVLADARHAEYKAARLQLPLKQNLARKKQLMQTALRAYEDAAAYEVAGVVTAAAYHTAVIYAELGQALLDSERPKNLDADALAEYDILLEDQAYPFEEQAIALHETNAARSAEGHYDAWIEQSLLALAQLVPAQYAKQERGASHVATLH
jgi:TolA-binding protein